MTLKLGKKGDKKQFRHTLISIVDVKSRVAVVRLLAEAIETLGLPESIRMDNGELPLQTRAGIFASVGHLSLLWSSVQGLDKPFVERMFRNLQHDFSERLQGFLSHDVAQRVERERGGQSGSVARQKDPTHQARARVNSAD